MENKDVLTGVDIAEDPVRKYTDSEVFSSIIGYTGQISEEEYSALSEEEQENRSRTDIVGKSGIEKAFDDILRGTNGETTFYVDMILSGSCFADSIRMGRSKRQSRKSDVNSYPSMPGIIISSSRRSIFCSFSMRRASPADEEVKGSDRKSTRLNSSHL